MIAEIAILITGNHGDRPHARFNERYNQRYSPPAFPPTPSLNNSFPEGLSKSLLQIAENQSRMIEAMKGKPGSTGSSLQGNDKN